MDELFDTFDENMQWTGTATRQEVHRLGIWHQTFHCWVLHRTKDGDFLVLQHRHHLKDTHPNKLDISCAGHLQAGESPSDGTRELKEELGIEVVLERLNKIGTYMYSDSDSGNGIIDNEFCHVYVLIQEDQTLESYIPALEEVCGLYLVRINDLRNLCLQKVDNITITGFELDSDGRKQDHELTVTIGDMIKYDKSYYEMLFANLP